MSVHRSLWLQEVAGDAPTAPPLTGHARADVAIIGGGYVGWRPSAPEIHDHRGQHQGPTFHDHRHGVHDSQWRFIADGEFGKGHIRPHLYKDLAQGLSVTTPVVRPSIKGLTQPGYLVNTLTPSVGDGNSQTPEFKSFLVKVEKA